MSVYFFRPHGTTRLTLNEFFMKFDVFSKICRDNSSFITNGQE